MHINIKLKNKIKGSLSVEATLLLPAILFIFFCIIYISIVHYQNNVLIAESIRAMNRSGAYYQYIDVNGYGKTLKDGETPLPFDSAVDAKGVINKDMINNRQVYRTVIDVISSILPAEGSFLGIRLGLKNKSMRQYVDTRISNIKFKAHIGNETKAEDPKATEIESKPFMFLIQDLKVKVGRAYKNPLSRMAQGFLGSDSSSFLKNKQVDKDIVVSSVVTNQSEYIRNFDTIYGLGANIYSFFKNSN